MRKLCFVLSVLVLPLPALAQQSFSLPSIGLPLPPIGLRGDPPWTQRIPWEQPQMPAWERQRLPWDIGHVAKPFNVDIDRRRHRNDARVVYVLQPYPIAVQQEPQIIVVQPPPVTRIVEVEVPARRPQTETPAPAPPQPPPFVPTGDRTVYVIPGCYVGNVPPKDVKLPANCDLSKVTTYVP